jgi:2-phospho-L-lactate transferase/gluconeogenesis factor (CofD/UPF0052 family)
VRKEQEIEVFDERMMRSMEAVITTIKQNDSVFISPGSLARSTHIAIPFM